MTGTRSGRRTSRQGANRRWAATGQTMGGGNGVFTAVNPDGTGKWSYSLTGHMVASPAIASDGTLYFGSDDSNLYALDSNGRVKWKFATDGAVTSTPALAKNGTVYFGGTDHNLYAIGADGTIYFQNGEGKLFAIQDTENNGGLDGQWPKRGAGSRNTARGVR